MQAASEDEVPEVYELGVQPAMLGDDAAALGDMYKEMNIPRNPERDCRLISSDVLIMTRNSDGYRFEVSSRGVRMLNSYPGAPRGRVLEFKRVG